ncbi:hypothetical protein D3C77_56950 [compost metagenome]
MGLVEETQVNGDACRRVAKAQAPARFDQAQLLEILHGGKVFQGLEASHQMEPGQIGFGAQVFKLDRFVQIGLHVTDQLCHPQWLVGGGWRGAKARQLTEQHQQRLVTTVGVQLLMQVEDRAEQRTIADHALLERGQAIGARGLVENAAHLLSIQVHADELCALPAELRRLHGHRVIQRHLAR